MQSGYLKNKYFRLHFHYLKLKLASQFSELSCVEFSRRIEKYVTTNYTPPLSLT